MSDKRANGQPPLHEVAIIGAGPMGIEMAIALRAAGMEPLHLEAGAVGETITRWPRNTEFFSTSERLALAGVPIQNTHQGRITGEEYLSYLRQLVELFGLPIHLHEPVLDIEREDQGFRLRSKPIGGGERTWRCRRLILASGDMDAFHQLGVPGEDLPHVAHVMEDPHRYFRTELLVVGGKNSAVESALRCWRAGAQVTISYRRAAFDQRRVKGHILPDVEAQIEKGTIGFLPETVPVAIEPGRVMLAPTHDGLPTDGPRTAHPTEFVLLCTGYEADMRLFEMAGVTLVGAARAPRFDPDTMETDVPGVYVCGTAAAGTQNRYTLFIENTHVHVGRITQHLTGRWPDRLGTIPARDYELPFSAIEAN